VVSLIAVTLAASLIDDRAFTALVAGFAAFASAIAFFSALEAFVSWISGEPASDTADSAAVGLAKGFPFASAFAILAILDSLRP
jgi:hypothetical protein